MRLRTPDGAISRKPVPGNYIIENIDFISFHCISKWFIITNPKAEFPMVLIKTATKKKDSNVNLKQTFT